jgi:hypothetical protein
VVCGSNLERHKSLVAELFSHYTPLENKIEGNEVIGQLYRDYGLNGGGRPSCLLAYQDIDPMDSLVPNCYDKL